MKSKVLALLVTAVAVNVAVPAASAQEDICLGPPYEFCWSPDPALLFHDDDPCSDPTGSNDLIWCPVLTAWDGVSDVREDVREGDFSCDGDETYLDLVLCVLDGLP